MTLFDDRERAHEARFAHDADLRFRCAARRGRLAGRWAADLIGLNGDAAETYARSIAATAAEADGTAAVFNRLERDLGATIDPATLRWHLDAFDREARRQVLHDG